MLLPTRSKLPSCGIELDGKAAHVAGRVGRSRDPATVEKRTKTGVLALGSLQKLGLGKDAQRLVHLEEPVRGRATGVDDALRDALMVEVR